MSIIPRGYKEGSLIGHIFDTDDQTSLPSFTLRMPPERQREWAERETERMRIVSTCPECSEPQTAESEITHAIDHTPDYTRHILRMLAALNPEQRQQVMADAERILNG